jgi:hypothetical protein
VLVDHARAHVGSAVSIVGPRNRVSKLAKKLAVLT